jgi:predicted small secreted protein
MRAAAVLTAVLALSSSLAACATPGAPGSGSDQATNQNDCAVIAAVAKGHYRFGPDNVPPPLWLFSEGGDWSPRCDWNRYGVSFPRTYDPTAQHQPGDRVQYVQFQKPVYDGRGATIEAGILHGPLAGMGVRCRVVSGIAGWTLAGQCENTWIS